MLLSLTASDTALEAVIKNLNISETVLKHPACRVKRPLLATIRGKRAEIELVITPLYCMGSAWVEVRRPTMSMSPRNTDAASLQTFGEQSLRMLGLPVRIAGFWTAVLVPFVLLGMIVSGAAQHSPLLVTGLLTANFVGLVLGRNYKR